MEYGNLPDGLERQTTYANLSAQDLHGLGKCASNLYLSGRCQSLGDAVIKVAAEHPSISAEQVRRVVELANTSTFLELFEKKADKNVEFGIADPSDVLRQINLQAGPSIVRAADADYQSEPVKTSSFRNLEADLALCGAFGLNVKTASMRKVAEDEPTPDQEEGIRDFIQENAGVKDDEFHTIMEQAGIEPDAGEEVVYDMAHDSSNALSGGLAADKDPADYPSDQMEMGKKVEKEHTDVPAVAQRISMDHLEEIPDYYDRLDQMEEQAKDEGMKRDAEKTSSLRMTALDYLQAGRDLTGRVRADLEKAASIQTIKKMAAPSPYRQHDPHRELIEQWHRLQKVAEDVRYAAEQNRQIAKEAAAQLSGQIGQSLLDGINLGEIVHAMEHVSSADQIKRAMVEVMPVLAGRGFDLKELTRQTAVYQMEKGASHRVPNLDSPLLHAFGSYVKTTSAQPDLDKIARAVESKLAEVMKVVGRLAHATPKQ
jgi:hypothetical protein